MKSIHATATLLLLLSVLLSARPIAQRRGGGSGGAGGRGGAGDATPILLTAYESAEYGFKFPAPPEFSIFTPEHAGRFRALLTERRIIYLVDLVGSVNAAVTVRYLPKAIDADLNGFRNSVESNPPQAKLPGYKKISVGMIKIGVARDKDAVEYVYTSQEKDMLTTTRQVVFIHNGNGFIFTCTAAEKDYASVDRKSFQPLFASIEFR